MFSLRVFVVAAGVLLFCSSPSLAEEGAVKSSYSKKKQEMVHFVEDQADSEEAASAAPEVQTEEAANPQAIEPAAGVFEENSEEKPDVAKMIKLPRK